MKLLKLIVLFHQISDFVPILKALNILLHNTEQAGPVVRGSRWSFTVFNYRLFCFNVRITLKTFVSYLSQRTTIFCLRKERLRQPEKKSSNSSFDIYKDRSKNQTPWWVWTSGSSLRHTTVFLHWFRANVKKSFLLLLQER